MTPTDNMTVTPEMIEAGLKALDKWFPDDAGCEPDLSKAMVKDIFLAMHEARPEPSPLPDGLVERLLEFALGLDSGVGMGSSAPLVREAADRLTRLEADNARLREALDPFARVAAMNEPLNLPDDRGPHNFLPLAWPDFGDFKRALKAIGGRAALHSQGQTIDG